MPVHFLHDRKKFMRILRRILIIALAVYAVLSASHGIYRGFGDLNYNLFIYRVDDNFRKYKKEFETLTKMVSKRFEDDFNGMDDLSSVRIDCTSDKIYYTYIYNDGRGSDIFKEAADADTAACFDSMRKNVFTRHSDNRIGFTDIRITKDQVSFLCDRPYAVVYSKKWPRYLFDPNSEHFDSHFVDPIDINWYQVIGKYNYE